MDIQIAESEKQKVYNKMCSDLGITREEAEPYISQYEARLKNLVDQYQSGVQRAATALTNALEDTKNKKQNTL